MSRRIKNKQKNNGTDAACSIGRNRLRNDGLAATEPAPKRDEFEIRRRGSQPRLLSSGKPEPRGLCQTFREDPPRSIRGRQLRILSILSLVVSKTPKTLVISKLSSIQNSRRMIRNSRRIQNSRCRPPTPPPSSSIKHQAQEGGKKSKKKESDRKKNKKKDALPPIPNAHALIPATTLPTYIHTYTCTCMPPPPSTLSRGLRSFVIRHHSLVG